MVDLAPKNSLLISKWLGLGLLEIKGEFFGAGSTILKN